MSEPVEAVLFDLDDTICVYEQTADEILEVAFEAVTVDPFFDGGQYIQRFDEFLDAGDGIDGIREACFTTFAEEAGHDPSVGCELADRYAAERDQTAVEFIPGAETTLEALVGEYRLGLVTNGDPSMQSQKLSGLGLVDHFHTVVHAGHDAAHKPDPEPFHLALDNLDASTQCAVHVGNSLSSDVAGAHNAGLRSIWLDRNGVEEPDPEPHHRIEAMDELLDEPWA